MKLAIRQLFYLILILIFFSCNSIKAVEFETPVNTTSKKINYQLKKTFQLDDSGVFANNDFDGARLNGFEKLNDSTAIVKILPENIPINNSPYYAFKVWSNKPQSFYFQFNYPKGYKHRYIPKLKTRGTWKVIDSSSIFKTDSIITIKLNLTKTPILVSGQEVQSSKQVKQWYTKIVNNNSVTTLKSIGKSKLGRDLPVLDIYDDTAKNKDVIVLLTRQHPPEVTGYYAFQYFLQTLLSNSELSKKFLKKYHVLAFPIMNPDGVDLGHWRHNAGGVDLNRDWSIYNQPEIKQTVKYITKTLKKNNTKLVLGLDFHSTWYDVFYTNKARKETALPSFIDEWFEALETNIPNYKVNEAAGNSKKPVSKGWFLYGNNAVGITYEIGDTTPKNKIEKIGEESAKQMMKILLKSNY